MNLQEIVKDFEDKFDGRICHFQTNYKAVAKGSIKFDLNGLPHLLGLHKLDNQHANKILRSISEDSEYLYRFKTNKNFNDVKRRITLYDFIEKVFIKHLVTECVVEKDIRPNSMRLSIAIIEQEKRQTIVLGLRKGHDNYFYPTTLHEDLTKKYSRFRKTKLFNIKMES